MLDKYKNKVNLMCYNIFFKDVAERSRNIQDLILKNDPDVLLLQEVSVSWIPYLQNFMARYGYSYYGYGRHGNEMSGTYSDDREQFTPILWKTEKYDLKDSGHFWLSSTPDTYSSDWSDGTTSKFPRCVNWVILHDKCTGGEFMALCIHTDPENDDVRTKSSMLTVKMVDKIRGELPMAMGGDWNMLLEDEAYHAVVEGGYPDARFIAKTAMKGGSFNAWGKRTEENYAYGDHIFVSDNMAAESFEVVDDYYDGVHISDHCPLKTVLYY